MIQEPDLFFIIGRPRSGTTLLRSLLDTHDKIIVPPEYPFLLNVMRVSAPQRLYTEKEKSQFFKNILAFQSHKKELFESLRLNEEIILQKLLNHKITTLEQAFSIVLSECYSSRLDEHPLVVGDKNPVYSLFIKILMRKFPSAKFIFLVRDPRAQYASLKRFDFEAASPILQALRWKKLTSYVQKFMKKYPERTYLIKYEDLVANPKVELSKICDFLGLEYQEEMLRFDKYLPEAVKENHRAMALHYHSSLVRPLSDSHTDKWKQQLHPSEISKIEFVAERRMKNYGYEISGLSKPVYYLFFRIFWVIYSMFLQILLFFILLFPPGRRAFLLKFVYKLSKIYKKLFH